jgi:tetratricopeptide (TPR) repeat protein
MTNFKFIRNIFFGTIITIAACSTTTAKISYPDTAHSDTTYGTSTQQLKSDKIPDSVFQMTNLRHLSINGMDCDGGNRTNCWMIKEIPSQIKYLKSLTTLRLTLNSIKTIPEELTELNYLRLIDLTDNAGLSCKLLLKKYSEAINDFYKTIELEPENGKAYFERGEACLLIGDNQKAAEDKFMATKLGYEGEE